jgi:general L-amino acid transport system permease protein
MSDTLSNTTAALSEAARDPVPALEGVAAAPILRAAQPPAPRLGPAAWLRANLFSSWWSTAITLLLGFLIVRWGVQLLLWGVVNAVWTVPQTAQGTPNTAACQARIGTGACWAVIGEKYRFILFGRYPYEQQWRPAIAIALFLLLYAASAWRRLWRRELILIWAVILAAIGVLMWGGVSNMPYVATNEWGGLPVTLILATFGLALSFPLAVLVALGRRSKLPAIKALCVGYVELIRGVPLITLLFMASVMFPLFMPEGLNPDKLLRAQVAIILFIGAYVAEVIRGGLQALPRGQYEAADALGLSYWRKMRLVILPQALRLVIPPLVSTFIGFFKDTSLVLIIGLYDLLKASRVAIDDPAWQAYSVEVFIMVAAIYFAFCWTMARYARGLERELGRSARR